MEAIGLKDRRNFLENYLNAAIGLELVEAAYPDLTKHSPKQKYRLTAQGKAFLYFAFVRKMRRHISMPHSQVPPLSSIPYKCLLACFLVKIHRNRKNYRFRQDNLLLL